MRTPQEILANLTATGLTAAQMALVAELMIGALTATGIPATEPIQALTVGSPGLEEWVFHRREKDRLRKVAVRAASKTSADKNAVVRGQSALSADSPSSLSSSYLLTEVVEKKEESKEDKKESPRANAELSADMSALSTDTPKAKCATKSANAQFDAFWRLCLNKVSKRVAEQAFTKALKRASFDEITAGMLRYNATNPDPKYIPHPTTWLNGDRWTDQPVVVTNTQRRTTKDAADDLIARLQEFDLASSDRCIEGETVARLLPPGQRH